MEEDLQTISEPDVVNAIQTKEDQLEAEREELLEHVSACHVNTLRQRVAWILNNFPNTRDSDITLQLKYWETFESEYYNGYTIMPDNLYSLTRLTSLTRERARIQNQYRLFVASQEVRQHRGTLEQEEIEKAKENKENYPLFTVYIDESGKTSSQLLLGSLWFLTSGTEQFHLFNEILDLKFSFDFKKEFHFKEMKKDELPIYKALINLFLKNASTSSFKLITMPRSGVKNVQDAFTELCYFLLTKGIDHEHETGRAPLPRKLQVWKDAEEPGSDKLMMASLKEKLRLAIDNIYEGKLQLSDFVAVKSEDNMFIQIADLFVSSAHRLLHRTSNKRNHKDDFAEYFFDALGMNTDLSPNEEFGDMIVHMKL